MKTLLTTAAFALVVAPAAAFAQSANTGVSNPPPAVIDANPDEVVTPRPMAKPSAAVEYTSSSTSTTSYGSYVPYSASGGQGANRARTLPRDPDADIVTSVSTNHSAEASADSDAGIVTYVPARANEVPQGTLIQTRIRETLSTASTTVGTPFTADVTAPMERDGRVIIPVGSTIHGRVTVARGGRRVSGAAALHLLPESVTLPDGTNYMLHAQVIDTTQHNVTRVNDEGTILRRDHIKGTLAAMSLTTGGAAATGAVFGGVPGALIGGGIGAGVSAVWWLKQDRQEVIPQSTGIVFSLSAPMMISPITNGTR